MERLWILDAVLGLLFTRGVVLEGTRNSYSVSLSFLICEMG